MQAETQAKIESITATIELLRVHVGYDVALARLAELEAQSAEADFWNDQAVAQEAMREKNRLERQLNMITSLQNEMDDAVGLIELGEIEGDQDVVAEAEEALVQLAVIADKRQLESLLSGEADGNDCFLEIHAGAGGTEAQDTPENRYGNFELAPVWVDFLNFANEVRKGTFVDFDHFTDFIFNLRLFFALGFFDLIKDAIDFAFLQWSRAVAANKINDAVTFTDEIPGLLQQLTIIIIQTHVDEDVAWVKFTSLDALLPSLYFGDLLSGHEHVEDEVVHLFDCDKLIEIFLSLTLLVRESLNGIPVRTCD